MTYPCHYTNTDTKKRYELTLTEGEIKASCSSTDWGAVNWEIEEKVFLLHTIQSHPEKGSGLGSLLMHLAAVEANASGCTTMKILSAAQTEREFYYKMGCKMDTSALADFDQSKFNTKEWEQLCKSCPVIGDPAEVVKESGKSVHGRWV